MDSLLLFMPVLRGYHHHDMGESSISNSLHIVVVVPRRHSDYQYGGSSSFEPGFYCASKDSSSLTNLDFFCSTSGSWVLTYTNHFDFGILGYPSSVWLAGWVHCAT